MQTMRDNSYPVSMNKKLLLTVFIENATALMIFSELLAQLKFSKKFFTEIGTTHKYLMLFISEDRLIPSSVHIVFGHHRVRN